MTPLPPLSSVFFSELTGQLLSLDRIPDCSGKTTGHEVCTRKLRHFYCDESFSHVYRFPEIVGYYLGKEEVILKGHLRLVLKRGLLLS